MNYLELLKSDLKDTTDPKVLAKYPGWATEVYKEQLRAKIAREELRLKELKDQGSITPCL